jgi:hypothetical protein
VLLLRARRGLLGRHDYDYDFYTPNAHTKYNLVQNTNCYTVNNTSDIILLYCGSNGFVGAGVYFSVHSGRSVGRFMVKK